MKIKIFHLWTCIYCPANKFDANTCRSFCQETGKLINMSEICNNSIRIYPSGNNFPDWCPLEDAEVLVITKDNVSELINNVECEPPIIIDESDMLK